MGGPGSGPRKKNRDPGINRAMALKRMALLAPLAVEVIARTINGDNPERLKYEAAVEVYEHNFGKPKQAVGIEGVEQIGVGMVKAIYELMAEARRKVGGLEIVGTQNLLKEGKDESIQRQEETAGILEEEKAGEQDVHPD